MMKSLSQHAPEMLLFGAHQQARHFNAQYNIWQEQSRNGEKLVITDWPDLFHTVITRVDIDTVVTWETQSSHCRLGLCHDADFAGDLCIFESHTFVLVEWTCKKANCHVSEQC